MNTVVRRAGVTAAALALATGGLVTSAGSATAAPVAKKLTVRYDAVGTSTIAKPNSTVTLGPATLRTRLAPDGSFTARLPLPPTTSTFKVLGFVPIAATVTFVPSGVATGKLTFTGATGSVTTTASYFLKLSNVKAGGIPTLVGSNCQTAAPVTIPLSTPAGQAFDLTTGGTVSGTFTIGNFANCGLTTLLLNALVPGPGNTASITLSNGRAS